MYRRGGRGWGHAGGEKSYVGVCAKLLRSMIYCANLRPYPRAPVWFLVPQGIREERYADNVVMQRCDRDCDPGVDPYTYVWKGSLNFSTISSIKFVSTTRGSFLSIPSTEENNGEKCSCCLHKCLTCLSLFSLSWLARSLSIESFLHVYDSKYPNMTSIMASVWIYHKSKMRTSPRVSDKCTLWRTTPLICCGPGGWGVICVRSDRVRLFDWGIEYLNALCCDVQWQVIYLCS